MPATVGLLLVLLALPHLPPGICSHDAGDLQVCAATLGIAHPPGYCLLVSAGYGLSRAAAIAGIDPARAVTLACLMAGALAVVLAALVQMRLGAGVWIAAASAAVLAAHPRVWFNLVTPEVYAPSLALLAGAAWFLDAYARRSRSWHLFLAALLLGAAVVSRPPMAPAIAGFALGLVMLVRGRPARRRRTWRTIILAAGGLLVPVAYSVGYLWLRDTPTTPCNYIERYHEATGYLPPADAGPAAKAVRVVWLMTGRQYRSLISLDGDLGARCRWLGRQLAPGHRVVLGAVGLLALVGAVSAWRRQRATAVFILGVGVSSALFLVLYRVTDDAANLLPLLWVAAVLAGVGADALLPRRRSAWGAGVTVVAFLAAGAWMVAGIRRMPDFAARADATAFVTQANLAGLPADALILTEWGQSAPLRYARLILARREDIVIITAGRGRWLRLADRYGALPGGGTRPVFFTRPIAVPRSLRLRPAGVLWRLEGDRGAFRLPPPLGPRTGFLERSRARPAGGVILSAVVGTPADRKLRYRFFVPAGA